MPERFTHNDLKTLIEKANEIAKNGKTENEEKENSPDTTKAVDPTLLDGLAMEDTLRDDGVIQEAKGFSRFISKKEQILQEIKSLIEELRDLDSQESSSSSPIWRLMFYTCEGEYTSIEQFLLFARSREDLVSFLENIKLEKREKQFKNVEFSKLTPVDGMFLEITKDSEEHDGGSYHSYTCTFSQLKEKPGVYYVRPIFPSIKKNTEVFSWEEIKETGYWVRPDGTRGGL